MEMELTFKESELLGSVRQRYANMFKRFMPHVDDFEQLVRFLVELQEIHTMAKKAIPKRLQAVNDANDIAAESCCNLSRFFKARSAMGAFNRFWRELYREIFTPETMAAITAAYQSQQLIANIETGFIGFFSVRDSGQDLVTKLESDHNQIRITFTNGSVLNLASLKDEDEVAKLREAYDKLPQHRQHSVHF